MGPFQCSCCGNDPGIFRQKISRVAASGLRDVLVILCRLLEYGLIAKPNPKPSQPVPHPAASLHPPHIFQHFRQSFLPPSQPLAKSSPVPVRPGHMPLSPDSPCQTSFRFSPCTVRQGGLRPQPALATELPPAIPPADATLPPTFHAEKEIMKRHDAWFELGSGTGNRTRVSRLRIWRPNP